MNPRKSGEVIESRVQEIEANAEEETFEVSPEAGADKAVSDEVDDATETAGEVSEVNAAVEAEGSGIEAVATKRSEEMNINAVNLKALARSLYQMGLDIGLAPDEAALVTSKTRLPAFITKEDEREFKEGLVEAYQEVLDESLQSLRRQLGVGRDGNSAL
jgi:hypothetical protein